MLEAEILKFNLLDKSVGWYRGLSPKQLCACDCLLNALRDDIGQGTTYRVLQFAVLLGLNPMLKSKQMRFLIKLSRGNDLAFLWFLWEEHYRSSNNPMEELTDFTINEQLILSAIAHLDMATTLRALDAILPKSEHSKKHQGKQQRQQNHAKQKRAQHLRRSPSSTGDKSFEFPYFKSLVKPKPFVPLPLVVKPVMYHMQFPFYDNYRDPMHKIPNENSRWFSDFQMSPAKREARRCLSEALGKIFSSHAPQTSSLCKTHRKMEQAMSETKDQLVLETFQRCMKLIDVEGTQKEKRTERIIRQLEREVERAGNRLRTLRLRQLTELRRIRGGNNNGRKDCQICAHLMSSPPVSRYEDGSDPRDIALVLMPDSKIPGHPQPESIKSVNVLEWGKKIKHKTIVDSTKCMPGYENKYYCPMNIKVPALFPNKGVIKVLGGDGDGVKKIETNDLDVTPKDSISSVESKFKFCSHPMGFPQLDYFKVFEPTQLEQITWPADVQSFIKSCCTKAVQAFDEELRFARKQNDISSHMTLESNESNDSQKGLALKDNLLEETNIDPDDRDRLADLLKRAVDTLKSNPYYVLVTLPNVHKLPLLLDWMADRYGKTYSAQELLEISHQSALLCGMISNQKIVPKEKPPNAISCKDMGADTCLRKINFCELENSRRYWMALKGYCLPGVNAETFFAYLPGRDQDITL